MQKVENKDYFGFEGQATSYAKYRPQYPRQFLEKVINEHSKGSQELCIDIATGTGFLANHMSNYFGRVIGLDISDA